MMFVTRLNLGFLRQARRNRHLSTEKVGSAIGKTRSAIWRYESGVSDISVEVLCRLLDLYRIDPQDVFVRTVEDAVHVGI